MVMNMHLTNTGVTLIPVETSQEAENAINEKTAMMWFLNREAPAGKIQHEEWLSIAKKHGLPTMIDTGCRCATRRESLEV